MSAPEAVGRLPGGSRSGRRRSRWCLAQSVKRIGVERDLPGQYGDCDDVGTRPTTRAELMSEHREGGEAASRRRSPPKRVVRAADGGEGCSTVAGCTPAGRGSFAARSSSQDRPAEYGRGRRAATPRARTGRQQAGTSDSCRRRRRDGVTGPARGAAAEATNRTAAEREAKSLHSDPSVEMGMRRDPGASVQGGGSEGCPHPRECHPWAAPEVAAPGGGNLHGKEKCGRRCPASSVSYSHIRVLACHVRGQGSRRNLTSSSSSGRLRQPNADEAGPGSSGSTALSCSTGRAASACAARTPPTWCRRCWSSSSARCRVSPTTAAELLRRLAAHRHPQQVRAARRRPPPVPASADALADIAALDEMAAFEEAEYRFAHRSVGEPRQVEFLGAHPAGVLAVRRSVRAPPRRWRRRPASAASTPPGRAASRSTRRQELEGLLD